MNWKAQNDITEILGEIDRRCHVIESVAEAIEFKGEQLQHGGYSEDAYNTFGDEIEAQETILRDCVVALKPLMNRGLDALEFINKQLSTTEEI